MSIALSTPTPAAPYLAIWTGASVDITSTTLGTAPVEIAVQPGILIPVITCTDASKSLIFYVAHLNNDKNYADSVDFGATLTIATATTSVRSVNTGASGNYFGEVATSNVRGGFDLRGIGKIKGGKWVLGIVSIDSATAVLLHELRWA